MKTKATSWTPGPNDGGPAFPQPATEITSEIYVTVKNHYAGRTPPHMQPRSYDETVSRYVDTLVAIIEAIDAAGHDRVRAALERRDGPATHWGDCIRRCIAALVSGRVDGSTRPLSTFPYVRAVNQMLGANRRDFEASALKWIALAKGETDAQS